MPRAKRRRECGLYDGGAGVGPHAARVSMSRFCADDEPLYGLGCQGSAVSLPRIVLAF